MLFLIRCCTKWSTRMYAARSKQPGFTRVIPEEIDKFVKHAKKTKRPEDLVNMPGTRTNDYDDFFGHYLTFVHELGKLVWRSGESQKRIRRGP